MSDGVIAGLLFTCVGIGLMPIAVKLGARVRSFRRHGARTKGTVVGQESGSSGTWRAVVQFTPTADGGVARRVTFVAMTQTDHLAKGEEVDVVYDRRDPTVATVSMRSEGTAATLLWSLAFALVALGAMAMLGVL